MASHWGETHWTRAWEDTKTWLQSHIIAWFLAFLLPAAASAMASLFIPPSMDFTAVAARVLVSGTAGLGLLVAITYAAQLVRVLKKQRDEARDLYQPIRELADIRTGDTISGKHINVSFMFQQLRSDRLDVVTFEGCTMEGPCLVAVGSGCKFDGCNMGANFANSIITCEPGKRYFGVGVFVHCTFKLCRFVNISFLLQQPDIDTFLQKVAQH